MNPKRETTLSNLLMRMGMPASILGYHYAKCAIDMVINKYKSGEFNLSITKELYPAVADKFNTTGSRVERAIRHAIEVACLRGDLDLFESIFQQSISYDKGKPTNSEFICRLSEYYLTELSADESENVA